jgi:dihydropteroate synthase
MHNRLQPGSSEIEERLGGRYIGTDYDDLIKDIRDELMTGVSLAHQNGIVDENIILDPGIGFGKTVPQNLELMDRLDEIKSLGYPLLVGPSRKSFIGYTLDLPPEDRLEGTAAAVALAIDRGADIIRIHDVKVMTRVARMTDAIVRR